MGRDFIWYEMGEGEGSDGYGILEIHERFTRPGPALELRLSWSEKGATCASWVALDNTTFKETWLWFAPRGTA